MCKNVVKKARQATDDNKAHAHCTLDDPVKLRVLSFFNVNLFQYMYRAILIILYYDKQIHHYFTNLK
jgi:hypothetical protein